MDINEDKQIFICEAIELLDNMESALLGLEQNTDDPELINEVFRAAHTVKGSAGLFGFDNIIEFTHELETLLDDIRNSFVSIDNDLISLLMKAKDYLVTLIEELEGKCSADLELGQSIQALLMAKIVSDHTSMHSDQAEIVAVDNQRQNRHSENQIVQNYHLSIRLSQDTFEQGFDVKSLFKNIAQLGIINGNSAVKDRIPPLFELLPESCFLGWELSLTTDADISQISEVFELMEGTQVTILPENSKLQAFHDLAEQLGEEESSLLGLWLHCKTFTESQADAFLANKEVDVDVASIEEKIASEDKPKSNTSSSKTTNQKVGKESPSKKAKTFIRVDADKLDHLVNLVGELILSSAKLNQLTESSGNRLLIESVADMADVLEDTRDTALGLRMVPIGGAFTRFHRVVRDTAQELDKKIILKTSGDDTELDKVVIEKIADPLTHMVRNAMDHGIEMPEDRLKKGKNEQGTIHLNAYHESGNIAIEVVDDGKGLDRDRIFNRAVDVGLVSSDARLSDNEIYQLIFAPGFSTAEQASNLSGRGVGMDVVKSNIEALRGSVDLESTPNKGCRTIIKLPLTLAIIDGLKVGVGEHSMIIPLDSVFECITTDLEQFRGVHECDFIDLRGEVLPLIRLDSYFYQNFPKTMQQYQHGKASVVVVQSGNEKVGLLVGQLFGEMQAVIKPLGLVFQGLQGFTGFTILGSGALALILDIPMLIKGVAKQERKRFNQA